MEANFPSPHFKNQKILSNETKNNIVEILTGNKFDIENLIDAWKIINNINNSLLCFIDF